MNKEILSEIYRAFVLLGAQNDLLGVIGSCGSLPDDDVLANLRAWNMATLDEVKGRTEHYGMTFHQSGCTRVEGQ